MEKIYMYQNSDCKEIDNIMVRRTDGTIAYCGKPDACVVLVQMTGDNENECFSMRYLNKESYSDTRDVLSTINILLDMIKNQVDELGGLANDLLKFNKSREAERLIKKLLDSLDGENADETEEGGE